MASVLRSWSGVSPSALARPVGTGSMFSMNRWVGMPSNSIGATSRCGPPVGFSTPRSRLRGGRERACAYLSQSRPWLFTFTNSAG
eukprot:6128266-Alexandrium_andersonii.AAC.1